MNDSLTPVAGRAGGKKYTFPPEFGEGARLILGAFQRHTEGMDRNDLAEAAARWGRAVTSLLQCPEEVFSADGDEDPYLGHAS